MKTLHWAMLVKRVVLAAVVGAAALGVTPSPASADSTVCMQNYQFVPTRLHAIDIEDWWDTHDEIEITAPGWSYRTSIGNGQVLWDYQMPESPLFARVPGSTFVISLYEWDGTSRRSLGSHTLTATEHSGGRSFYLAGDYSYTLDFFVDDVNSAGCEQRYTVPNTIGMWAPNAVNLLKNRFAVTQVKVSSCLDPGTVESQSPLGGDYPQGYPVTIWVRDCSGNAF